MTAPLGVPLSSYTTYVDAVADNVTNVTPAFEAALEEAMAGNKHITIPPAALPYYLPNGWQIGAAHGLTIIGDGATIRASGAAKAALTTFEISTNSHFALDPTMTWYNLETSLSPYQRGTNTVTLDNEADASHFAVDDMVWIRTRETVPGGLTETPVAEMNIIKSIVGPVITFIDPLAKQYTYDAAYAFAIAKANNYCKDLTIRGLTLENVSQRPLLLYQVFNAQLTDIKVRGSSAYYFRGRWIRANGLYAEITPDWASGYRPYALALDTGTSDVIIDNFQSISTGMSIFHCHEGCANIRVRGSIRNGEVDEGTAEEWPVNSIRALSWDVDIDLDITNSPRGNVVDSHNSGTYSTEGNENLVIAGSFSGTVRAGYKFTDSSGILPDYRRFRIDKNAVGVANDTDVVPLGVSDLRFQRTDAPGTAPTAISSSVIGWACADAATTEVASQVIVPERVKQAVVRMHWVNGGAGAGNVVWQCGRKAVAAGEDISAAATDNAITSTAGLQNIVVSGSFPVFTVEPGERFNIEIRRLGTNGSDTLANDAILIGAEVLWYP